MKVGESRIHCLDGLKSDWRIAAAKHAFLDQGFQPVPTGSPFSVWHAITAGEEQDGSRQDKDGASGFSKVWFYQQNVGVQHDNMI